MTSECARRVADGLLLIGLAGLAFLLGCQELFDSDVWWHLRAGRWIVEHRAVPRVDPFTFGSAGRPWVDLHWLFQLALFQAHRAAGVAGVILLAAGVVTAAFTAGFALRDRDWAAWVVAAAWLPGLLLASTRFDPRPEIATLLGLAVTFGVLVRARCQPAWLWLLVPLQLLWINAHGLFVLGPWMMGLFLLERAVMPAGQPSWRSLLPPCVAAAAVCLVNPYGVRGVLFPLELFPKLTQAGGLYKEYIAEFMSPRMMAASYWSQVPGRDLYLRLFVFELTALPAVALVISLRHACASAARGEAHARAWAAGMVLALALALAVAAGLPGPGVPAYRLALGRAAPWAAGAIGIAAALALERRSGLAVALAVTGSGAIAAWMVWLVNHLTHFEPSPVAPAFVALGLGVPAALLTIRVGARPFAWWVAGSMAFVALLSVRNMSLFGLVGGSVLAAELGAFAAQLGHAALPQASTTRVLAPRLAVLGVMGVLGLMVVSDQFYAATEECHHFGLRERTFYYAHDACRFAARPGMPARAMAFGLTQAGVYVEQNGPARQVFIDGRLEVASREAFELNVRIHRAMIVGDPRWEEIVARMGNPLILLDNEDNTPAEATLVADPRWRCVYIDGTAMVFLPKGQDSELERAYPTIDFAGEHFGAKAVARSASPAELTSRAKALVRIVSTLAHRPVPVWSGRIPLLLVAIDCARQSIADSAKTLPRTQAGSWMILGHSVISLVPEQVSDRAADGPAAPWDPAVGLPWAQASTAYRESFQRDPREADGAALRALEATFTLRGMPDAIHGAPVPPAPAWPGETALPGVVEKLLREGRPAAALGLGDEAKRRAIALAWHVADRLACAALHLGHADAARRYWRDAPAPPSPAVRAARLADADLAAWNLAAAERGYHRALELDPALADAQFGLALVGLEQGRAAEALQAARAALESTAEPRRRLLLEGIVSLCERYVQ